MKMFPHAFVPSSDAMAHRGLFKIDVENAVELMFTASDQRGAGLRQQFRQKIIATLPSEAIDWDTVDWARLCPFKSSRR